MAPREPPSGGVGEQLVGGESPGHARNAGQVQRHPLKMYGSGIPPDVRFQYPNLTLTSLGHAAKSTSKVQVNRLTPSQPPPLGGGAALAAEGVTCSPSTSIDRVSAKTYAELWGRRLLLCVYILLLPYYDKYHPNLG